MEKNSDPRIVVVGGGFAGFWAAVAARRVAPKRLEIVLVSREPRLQIRPRLYEADPASLQVDLVPLLDRVDVGFRRAEATGVDLNATVLELNRRQRVDYSRLVIATGSRMRRPPIPGADEAHAIDTVREAIAFDQELARVVAGGVNPTIAVIGAGFTGIELSLELRDRIRRHGSQAQAERAKILVFDRAAAVGPELGPGPRPVIQAALTAAGVELRLGATVTRLSPNRVVLADGEMIAVDAVVLTTGLAAAEFVKNVPGTRDELGRIIVDQFLRAPHARELFVAGDAAAVDGGDGHIVLQSCQHALQLGRFAGENAARDLVGLPLIPYVQPPYITCLDLGRSGAVFTRGWERVVERTGEEAKAVKRRINTETIYPPFDATREELLRMSSLDPALQRRRRQFAA